MKMTWSINGWGRCAACAALVPVLVALPWAGASEAALTVACQAGIAVIFAASFHLLFGIAGMLWFAHAVTFGTGAYAVAHLIKAAAGQGLPPVPVVLMPLFAALAAGLLSAVIGWVVTRREKLAFAMISLGIGELVVGSAYLFRSLSGGEDGIAFDRSAGGAWLGMDFGPQRSVYWLILTCAIATVLLVRFIERTPLGLAASAVRENPERLAFLGYNVRMVRWLVFTAAGTIAGAAGALAALNTEHVGIASLSLDQSALPLIAAILGGVGSLAGTICAAIGLTLLQAALSTHTPAWLFYLGTVFTCVVLFASGGLAGVVRAHLPLFGSTGKARHAARSLARPYAIALIAAGTTALGAIALVELAVARRLVGGNAVSAFAISSLPGAGVLVWLGLLAVGLAMMRPAVRAASSAFVSVRAGAVGGAS